MDVTQRTMLSFHKKTQLMRGVELPTVAEYFSSVSHPLLDIHEVTEYRVLELDMGLRTYYRTHRSGVRHR
ncbi:hypothetical protein RRG08_012870 [Elysia crispata]|uniref:Uncharacterized protein n=1 Tax=Elysia crispata TaxID=231223 RepID=A0AAE1ASH4_9GAST|nr:hypothetical protein RRG08_012870 [Elysia crispata]